MVCDAGGSAVNIVTYNIRHRLFPEKIALKEIKTTSMFVI